MIDLRKLKELTSSLSVLYVEDESSIRDAMAKYLNKFFSIVVLTSNGLEGLDEYKKQKFDIVITDLSMPKMSGTDMIEKIREINSSQSILITSAHSESDYMYKAIKTGVDGYIIKPFDFNQLNDQLYKIVDKIKIKSDNEEYKSNLKKMVETKTFELKDNHSKTLLSMVELIEQRDTYTAGHSKRVAKYSSMIAQGMGFSEQDCTLIYQAGILHDIGKIATPDSILLNPRNLNDIEYKLIQEHVTTGFKLLSEIPMFKSLADIIYTHHERYDGSGYPRALKGDEILPLGQVMIVADAFDAMTTSRIYKARKSVAEALGELVSLSSKQFHEAVVKVACEVLKDIKIDESINQLPQTKLEEERFAYFYKDILSNVYNQNYLEVVLSKNIYNRDFKYMDIISINNFSEYNKKNSWQEGDELLKKISQILNKNLVNSFIFRVFGDDFVILSVSQQKLISTINDLDTLISGKEISYKIDSINLMEVNIPDVRHIEIMQNRSV